jgi:hypothetical protein
MILLTVHRTLSYIVRKLNNAVLFLSFSFSVVFLYRVPMSGVSVQLSKGISINQELFHPNKQTGLEQATYAVADMPLMITIVYYKGEENLDSLDLWYLASEAAIWSKSCSPGPLITSTGIAYTSLSMSN